MAACPDRTDPRLRRFLAEEYGRRGLRDQAAQLLWGNFADQPTLAAYEELHVLTSPAGTWPGWRDRALAILTEEARAQEPSGGAPADARRGRDGSVLVTVLLWEGDSEAAWNAALLWQCSQALWLELARAREDGNPEDAIAVYKRVVEQTIGQKNNRAYGDAVSLIRRIARLMAQGHEESAFRRYVGDVRAAHKPKRNLMKLFDAEGWR